jgi:hypothetical protein
MIERHKYKSASIKSFTIYNSVDFVEIMKFTVLSSMTPGQVRINLESFAPAYVKDWEEWLSVGQADRVNKFAAILRSWQATRPHAVRRPRREATHEPPFIDDLLAEAAPYLESLGDTTVANLPAASPLQIDALHGLWAVFLNLSQKKSASCVGITKAVMLLTYGRIGPAFDSQVRKRLGLRRRLNSSGEWIDSLYLVSSDIRAFEEAHGCLTEMLPDSLARYHPGRLYDMVLGPKARDKQH